MQLDKIKMIYIIVISIISAIAFLALAVFTPWWYLAFFTCVSMAIFGITYFRYNRQKHPEEYKKTNKFNPDARIVTNGSKIGTVITIVVLALNILAGAAVFLAVMLFSS